MISITSLETENIKAELEWNGISKSILKALLYFNIFNYPLKKEELLKYCHKNITLSELDEELKRLINERQVFKLNDFYSINQIVESSQKRKSGNLAAEKLLNKAKKHTKWLLMLPFIECVCISGSLSKMYADEKSDVDYFIITKRNRLWIFRTITGILAKLLIIIGKRKYLCPNFMVTTDKLTIQHQNILAANELITLIPIYGQAKYMELLNSNSWIRDYFPATQIPNSNYLIKFPSNNFSAIMALVDKFKIWDHINQFLYTSHKWYYDRKFKLEDPQNVNYSISHYKMHPIRHRSSIITKYKASIEAFQLKNSVDLEAKY